MCANSAANQVRLFLISPSLWCLTHLGWLGGVLEVFWLTLVTHTQKWQHSDADSGVILT